MITSPYEAALLASDDESGAGWYVETWAIGTRSVCNVYDFGPKYVLMQDEESDLPPLWVRWDDLLPCVVILDGAAVGVDLRAKYDERKGQKVLV